MPVRSRSVAAVDSINVGSVHFVYTVPAGRTLIVKWWSAYNATGSARSVRLLVRRNGVNVSIARHAALPALATLQLPGEELVANPGDMLGVQLGTETTNGGLEVYVSGSLLEGEPQ